MVSKKCRLIVSYHKPSRIFNDPLYFPINAGRALLEQKYNDGLVSLDEKNWLLDNTAGDDTGDNISELNYSFCELTAIYWVWKNYEKIEYPDFVGFCHYRRIFDVDSKTFDVFLGNHQIVYAGLENISQDLEKLTVYEQFSNNHKKTDMERCLEYFKNNDTEFYNSLIEYLELPFGKSALYNMFIMPKDVFFEYCELIFGMLFNIKEKFNLSSYSFYGSRIFGFLCERITGAFLYHKFKHGFSLKKSVPFFFDEKYIKVKPSTSFAENIEVIDVFASKKELLLQKNIVSIAIPMNVAEPDLTFLTLESCIDNSSSDCNCHIYLFCNADLNAKRVVLKKIRNYFGNILSQKNNFGLSLVIPSKSLLQDIITADQNAVRKIIDNPSLWFFLLDSKICQDNNIFWLNSGYLFNDNCSVMAEKMRISHKALCGCESFLGFISNNAEKGIQEIEVDFSLSARYMQINFLYIDLELFNRKKIKFLKSLIEFNGAYVMDTLNLKDYVNYEDYCWSMEVDISKSFSLVDRRLSFDNYLKFINYRNIWKGLFIREYDSNVLNSIGSERRFH